MTLVLKSVHRSMENTYLVTRIYPLGPDSIDSSNNEFEIGFSCYTEKKIKKIKNSSDSKINQRQVAPWCTRQPLAASHTGASEVTTSVSAELPVELTVQFHITAKSEYLMIWHPNFTCCQSQSLCEPSLLRLWVIKHGYTFLCFDNSKKINLEPTLRGCSNCVGVQGGEFYCNKVCCPHSRYCEMRRKD